MGGYGEGVAPPQIIEIMLYIKKKLFQNAYHIVNVKQQVTQARITQFSP